MLNLFNDNASSDSDQSFLSLLSDGSTDDGSFVSLPSLADSLEAQFSDVPKNFNVVHINAQSIPAHYPDMQASLLNKNIQAIVVSETWLKPCLPTTLYSLPGFHLIRNDRTSSRGGGVAIYLRSNIPFSVISTSPQPPPSNAGEHLFVEVILSNNKILLGAYYSHSSSVNYFSSFEKILEDLIPLYSHNIILGDFNTCLLKQDHRTHSFESIIKSCNMHILPFSATHHAPNYSPSLLDLCIVSSPQHVAKHGQCSADNFSYHDLIFLSYKIRPPKIKPKVILQRNFSGMNKEKMLQDASNIDWSPVTNAVTVDDQVAIFNSMITQLYDKHAPLRAIKLKHRPAAWLTDDIKLLMSKKCSARHKYKCRPNDSNKEKYVKSRNRCNMVCRDALRRHIHKSVDNDDPAKVWQFLRSFGIGKSLQDSIPNNINIDSLNLYFSSVLPIDVSEKSNTINYLSTLPIPDYSPFVFNRVSACDVKKSLLSITSNAVGGDGISRNMIVPILDIILPVLCLIFNNSMTNGIYPTIWKDAQLIPLPKKPNPKSFTEYRPISILPFLSKVLERLVHSQISKYLSSHDLLNPFQSGFRPGHSTVSTLVKITDDIRLSMDNRNLTILTLLDFSNAFNTVDFDILLAILRSINISPTVLDWFHSYLFGRRQRIRLEEKFSSWCDAIAGVPQGGVLSPLLFAIFINSISNNFSSSYHLYADDLQIYSKAPLDQLSGAVDLINADLNCITTWCRQFGLKINHSKTQVMIVGSSQLISKVDLSTIPSIHFDGVPIPYSTSLKNLGLTIDHCLSWAPQLQVTSRKLYATAGALKRLRNFLPVTTKIALVQSLLLPILDYADVCYPDLTENQLDKLERLQNFCIRFIFGLRKYDHISQYRSKLKWLPIRLRRNAHILSLLYNILFNPLTPRYLKERFNFLHNANVLNLRSSENLALSMPQHGTVFYDHSFSVKAVRLWNLLPVTIRRAQSLSTFKSQVKSFYLAN